MNMVTEYFTVFNGGSMKKKLLALFMAVMLAFNSTGCGQFIDDQVKNYQNKGQTDNREDKDEHTKQDRSDKADSDRKDSDKSDSDKADSDIDKKDTLKDKNDKEDEIRYQDDYYEYVNSNLLSKINFSATDAHWDWFSELNAYVHNDLDQIIYELKDSTEDYEKGSSEQKIRDMYECVSDMDNRDKTGLGPLEPHLNSIRNANSIEEYIDAMAKLSGEFGFSSIVGGYTIMQDMADSGKYAVYLMYADTLIGKEYVEDEASKVYVDRYFEYVRDMLMEYGMTKAEAEKSSAAIERLLRDICSETLTKEQYYNPNITYNTFTSDELKKLYTNVDIDKMLKTLRIDGQSKYIIKDVNQAKKINSLLIEENLQDLKDYSTFVLLNDAAEYSTRNFAKLKEDMENYLYGITQSWGDEKQWRDLTRDLLPWDFGAKYVEEHFSQQDKEDVEEMIQLIMKEYEDIIMAQEWMSDETKQKAIRKLETMQVKIGYPDIWPASKDMMQVTPISEGGSLLSNLLVSMNVSIEDSLANLGGEVDRSEWNMTPQTINATYDPLNNEVTFPAAILQAPIYNSENSEAGNLGGIGFVIAHEISHAFDSSGSLYDEYGNYNDWWNQDERAEYEKLSESIVEYYNNYEMMGQPVNGELTLMENIADLGALTCITAIIGDDKEALDDAFGQMAYNWAAMDTESYMKYLLNTDTHSPNKIRVNATLSSCDAFYYTYDIKETDGMYVAPQDRVGIWVQ